MAAAVVDQRLMVLSTRRGFTLALNTLTTQTAQATLLNVAGFIAVQLKAAEHYSKEPLVPQELGEWLNETFNGLMRDPNAQRTGNVSAAQWLQRSGPVSEELAVKQGPNWERVLASAAARQHRLHAADDPAYSTRLSRQDVHNGMAFGEYMWRQVLLQGQRRSWGMSRAVVHAHTQAVPPFVTLPNQP